MTEFVSHPSIGVAPDLGTYIAFSFDIEETLKVHYCDEIGEETKKILMRFNQKLYVGCCFEVRVLFFINSK